MIFTVLCFRVSLSVYVILAKVLSHVLSALMPTHWFIFPQATRSTEVFELLPTKMCLPSHSHAFAVITFTPTTMQAYHGTFEVTLEGASR